MLYSMYPSSVKHWISARGGLTPHMIFLRGKELQALYKPCYLDAQASSATKTPAPAPARAPAASAAVCACSWRLACSGFCGHPALKRGYSLRMT